MCFPEVGNAPRISERTMRKLLSHHEIAILLLLFNAPGQVSAANPDVVALQQERLVEVISSASEESNFQLTSEGVEILRRLGMTAS
jgi:hypothetical protein